MRFRRGAQVREIVQTGHPVLRQQAAEVELDWIATDECQRLVDDMVATMHAAPGVGLAAPQIAVPLRIFVVEDRPSRIEELDEQDIELRKREAVELHTFINPMLEHVDESPEVFYEGCLSVDGFAAVVARSNTVKVSALDRHGKPFEVEWTGWPARILQHEFDHLEGTLYIDRMQSRTFSMVELLHDD